jgi:hypothetical protein
MISRQDYYRALAVMLASLLACAPAHALVSLNDGHDHVYVTGTVGFGWDSNVFANSNAESDSTMNATVVADYTRRAGWIGVNASVAVDATQYSHFSSESFRNPRFSAELTKQTGRTTGSLTLSAARQSRADAAVNIRTTSWNYATGLSFRYPIVTIYTLSGQLGYSTVKYENNQFPQLSTYSASADLIRVFSTERDVMLGYRYRHGQTSTASSYNDHAVTAGLTGKLIRGINGSVRFGYQLRQPNGYTDNGMPAKTYHSWTASGSTTYAFNKRLNFTGTLAKDFSTTATDVSVDTSTASLDAQYAFSSHWTFSGNVSGGDSRFLGDAGRTIIHQGPPLVLGPSRHDDYVTASVSANYSLNEHLKVSAAYIWFKNWSTSSFADFVRTSYNLNVASRW